LGRNWRGVALLSVRISEQLAARSRPDFIAKLKIVEEECDESIYWLEMIESLGLGPDAVKSLLEEANQLLAIIVASIKTTRQKT
jgi:four helix bundle protein